MNNKLVWCFFLCFVISLGEALECYECRTRHDQNCYSTINKDIIPKHNCRNSDFILRNHDGLEYECVAYLERNNRTNSTDMNRHCVIKNDFNCARYAEFRSHKGFTVDKCYVCDNDLCNSGQSIVAVFTMVMVFVLVERFCI